MKAKGIICSAIFAAVMGGAFAVCADALDVMLAPSGDIRFGEGNDRTFRMLAALPGWKGLSAKGSWEMKKPGVAQFAIADGGHMLMDAVATLDQLPEGRVCISYSFTPVEDVELVSLGCTLTQPSGPVVGKPWETPSRSGVFARPANDGIHVMGEKGKEISVALGGDGVMLTFRSDSEIGIAIQDNWRWVESYSLRLGTLSQKTWKKGETKKYEFTVSANVPLVVKSAKPTVIVRGPEWIPLNYRKDIEAGSALDFSHMGFTDAPAGKYGWMQNVGGHFEFEGRPGKPVRLYGVNLCNTANFLTHDEADMLVTRLKRLGYNAIRLHHHDAGLVEGSKDGLTLNNENLDRFDYLLAAAIREGLYLTTDLFVSRSRVIEWRHIGVDRDGKIDNSLFKALCGVYEPAFENWCAFSRSFMTHVNPYTGRAYKDEPAMSLISLVNEGGFPTGWYRETAKDERIRAAWRKWLVEKRAADPSFYPDVDAGNTPAACNVAAFAIFMGEVEAKMVARMKAFLRGLGCRALFTNNNCGPHYAPVQAASAEYDYIDDHFYVDHPQFLGTNWSLPSRCENRNPVLMRRLSPCRIGFLRMADKPFTVTEWNFAGPSMFRSVGGILTGAMAAMQDWDGLWRFAYAHGRGCILEDPNLSPGYFDLSTDPLSQASDRASICLFLRGDIAPFAKDNGVSLLVTPESVKPASDRAFPYLPSWDKASWNMRVGSCLSSASASVLRVIPREKAEDPAVTNWVQSVAAPASMHLDREKGSFTIDTPRTCGGFAPSGTIVAGPLTVTLGGAAATVWASSLDDAPVTTSQRILLSHLTDVQGEGAKFADSERTILLSYGKGALVRNGTAKVELALAAPCEYAVYELETSGRRMGTVHSEVVGGKLSFITSVDGPHGARMLYEIIQSTERKTEK